MPDFEEIAEATCHEHLSAQDLKTLCRYRGFHPPSGGKEEVAAFAAVRFLDPAGVAEAAASLDAPWDIVLHRIALAPEPVGLRDISVIVQSGKSFYDIDYRSLFRRVGDNLLNRGLVLVEDQRFMTSRTGKRSRFESLVFRVAESHLPQFPRFPVPTKPLRPSGAGTRPAAFCREVLSLAVAGAGASKDSGGDAPVAARVARAFSFADGKLRLNRHAVPDVEAIMAQARALWTHCDTSRKTEGNLAQALRGAEYILQHLSPDHGVEPKALVEALSRLGLPAAEAVVRRFCEDGCDMGILLRGESSTLPCYGAAPVRASTADDAPLAFSPAEKGVAVDLARTGLAPFLSVAAVSRVEVTKGRLCLVPDIVLLGRLARKDLDSISALKDLCSASEAFRKAVEHVTSQKGKVVLHEGLLVLRVEDLGLRTIISSELGPNVRALGGPYLAVPAGLSNRVEKLARKEGFSPRRVTQ